MNNFFNNNTTKTYSVSTTKGDFTFTAQDLAKIIAFGPKYVSWSGNETYISHQAAADMVAIFCTDEGQERGHLREVLRDKASQYGENTDAALQAILVDALEIVYGWANLKLYTCLTKKIAGTESRHINLDRLEAALGIELGDTVRERLSYVSVEKTEDGDWAFDSGSGRAYRDTATIGTLVEVRDAVQFFDTMLSHCVEHAKQGLGSFEEIAEASYSINIERWTQSDKDDMKRALAEANIQPDPYTVYYTSHNEFNVTKTDGVEERWDYVDAVAEFNTKTAALLFMRQANDNYFFEKKRAKLLKQICDYEVQLDNARAEYDSLLS